MKFLRTAALLGMLGVAASCGGIGPYEKKILVEGPSRHRQYVCEASYSVNGEGHVVGNVSLEATAMQGAEFSHISGGFDMSRKRTYVSTVNIDYIDSVTSDKWERANSDLFNCGASVAGDLVK